MDGSKDLAFGYKQFVLFEGIKEVIQDFLIDRKEKWIVLTGQDFFSNHPQKKWKPAEKEKIDRKEITQWDISLCITWLLDFPWKRMIPHRRIIETKAIQELRKYRNDVGHDGTRSYEVTEASFNEKCTTVRDALTDLGLQVKAEDVIRKARRSEVKLYEETPWEYETLSILGSGSFGVVLKSKHKLDHQFYAVKIVPYLEIDPGKREIEKENMKKEARSRAKLNHINIVSYKDSDEFCFTIFQLKSILLWGFEENKMALETIGLLTKCFERAEKSYEKSIDCLFIKMELCGKNLRDWTQIECSSHASTFEFQYSISQQLIDGLNYIHKNGIVHGDLRPDNIFFEKSSTHDFPTTIKIDDFGLSNQLEGYESLTMTRYDGSKSLYRAPEMDEPHKDGAKYGKAVDMFALGLILSEIFDAGELKSLRKKFDDIIYDRNTGDALKSTPWLDTLILQLTNEEDKMRFFRNKNGVILPISLSTNMT